MAVLELVGAARDMDWLSRESRMVSPAGARRTSQYAWMLHAAGAICLIDIIATYSPISGKEGRAAATMQCDSQEF